MSRTFQKIYDALGEAYKVLVERDENGIDTQVVEISNTSALTTVTANAGTGTFSVAGTVAVDGTVATPPFPEIPNAVSCEISGLTGSTIVKVYKDALDATLATLTITFIGDDEITQVWS